MSYIQPFTLSAYSVTNGGATRTLLALKTEAELSRLRDEAVRTGARRIGDWYAMPSIDSVLSLQRVTKGMGGIAYNLPIV